MMRRVLGAVACFLGWHGPTMTTQRFCDYYHDRFTTICLRCHRVIDDRRVWGDWG